MPFAKVSGGVTLFLQDAGQGDFLDRQVADIGGINAVPVIVPSCQAGSARR